MDRLRYKNKKENPVKHVDKEKEKSSMYIPDLKTIKENLKIKEILRTVKMNSSMRIKAPRGSTVMTNKDFADDLFDLSADRDDEQCDSDANLKLVIDDINDTSKDISINCKKSSDENIEENQDITFIPAIECNIITETTNTVDETVLNEPKSIEKSSGDQTGLIAIEAKLEEPEAVENLNKVRYVKSEIPIIRNNSFLLRNRDRKFSLDHTILTRREGLSQSEVDLHTIGKSSLERKSSFFRKKMDILVKNTSEMFKRQSWSNKPQNPLRRESMSMSLQSLNETRHKFNGNSSVHSLPNTELQDSTASLHSTSTMACSACSLESQDSTHQGHQSSHCLRCSQDQLQQDQNCNNAIKIPPGIHPTLSASQPLGEAESVHCLNEALIQESLLSSRAISMSSGLDTAHGQSRRKTSRSNRVTWVASEGLTNYLRRIIQDEKSKETQPQETHYYGKQDSKGRRLSYQRAVSGEDPTPLRYSDTNSLRRRFIPENSEANDLVNLLAEFSLNGVPSLQGFNMADISEEAKAYLAWAELPANLEEVYDWKKLSPNEEARQAVIRELVNTESFHIRHLMTVVEVFMAAAHALQDAGKILDLDTERLFSNIPDVVNASLYFWETTILPMIADAVQKRGPYNTELMVPGFYRFRDIFQPYEKFVNEQTKALDYLRSLSTNAEFMTYLTWCHTDKTWNRLQLADIMVKPMQRLTKYSLILRRIIEHTETEPERTSLITMETFAKSYVLDLNRSIRQREELEQLDELTNMIEPFEIDFKDEDMDRCFKMYSQLNLRAPMVNCVPGHSRTIIFQGDLRFKDNAKEIEVRVFLLTDILLICKKQSKGSSYPYKLIRPKYMVDKLMQVPRFGKSNPKEITSLIFVVLDELSSSYHCFCLSDTNKDSGHNGLKLWEQKVREAKLTYDLGVWFAKNPSRDPSEVEMDNSSEVTASGAGKASKLGNKQVSDDANIEREARERVAAMLHRSMGVSTEYEFSQASINTDSADAVGQAGEPVAGPSGVRAPRSPRYPMHRNSTGGSSRNSRLSSFQQSTSATSHDEPGGAGSSRYNVYRAGSSVEHIIPPLNRDNAVTSITVNVVSESESDTVVPVIDQQPTLQRSGLCHNTLRVQPHGVMALVHSLPDLSLEHVAHPPPASRPTPSPTPLSASDRLYQSHHELLQRNRLLAAQRHQHLSPNHRGTSYPPPSPSRGSLKRGLAFSYSFKNPPLLKMGHVNSQAQQEAVPITSQPKADKSDKNQAGPSTSSDKDKKSKNASGRNKGSRSRSPTRKDKEDKNN